MVQKKDEEELKKARKVVERAEKKEKNRIKSIFREAALTANKWRTIGRLQRVEFSTTASVRRVEARG